MSTLPSRLLRQYYEESFGRREPGAKAFEGTTFEEYYALRRIQHPDISKWKAAIRSPLPAFKKLAKEFPADERKSRRDLAGSPDLVARSFRNRERVDLHEEDLEPETEFVLLDRVGEVRGLDALGELPRLVKLMAVITGMADHAPAGSVIELDEIAIQRCSEACLTSLLATTAARFVTIDHVDSAVVDLARLVHHRRLKRLTAAAGLIRGVGRLIELSLAFLHLENVPLDAEFRELLFARSDTLEELWIENHEPFGPMDIPEIGELEALTRVRVPGYEQYRQAWLSFAVEHRDIGFDFRPVRSSVDKPKVTVENVYRGVAILRVERGTGVGYEVSGDLSRQFLGERGIHNYELADALRERATTSGVHIEVLESADEVIVKGQEVAPLKWALDVVSEGFS